MSHVALAVDRIIDELGITDLADMLFLEEIAWARGVLVNEALLEGAEARLVIARTRGIITVSSAVQDPRRKRFSIAHELGHFEMHRARKGLSLCVSEDIRETVGGNAGQDLEQEANEFASSLLLPSRFFAAHCREKDPSLEYIAELADQFYTSLTATSLRYLEFCEEPVAVVFSQDNRIKWFQGSKDFEVVRDELGFFIDVHARLDPSSLASELFQDKSLQIKKKRVQTSVWFTPGRYMQNATILEHSLVMPTYNAVLTLLWVDEDLEENELFYGNI